MLTASVALLPTLLAPCKATRLSPRTLLPTTVPVAFLPLLVATARLVVAAAAALDLDLVAALVPAQALVPAAAQDRAPVLDRALALAPAPVLVLPPAAALVPLHPPLPLPLATLSPSPQQWAFCLLSLVSSCYKHFPPLQFFIFIHDLGSTYRKGNHVLYHTGSFWQMGLF